MSIISIIINQAMSIYRSGVLVIDYLTTLVATVAGDVWNTLVHNWPYLLASVVVASLVQVYVSADHLATWLRRRTWVAILGAVALGALTPFCSCGTTAIVLGAMASSVPWAPIVAFLVSSPLTSPEEYVLSVGLFGPAFATTFFVAAIAAGLIGGGASWWLESRGLLAGQARMAAPGSASSCGGACEQQPGDGDPVAAGAGRLLTIVEKPATAVAAAPRLRQLGDALLSNTRRLALYFLGFAAIGYLVIRVLPTDLITGWLGTGNPFWSVPLAAVLGIPVYLNSDASLPLVASLLHGGMAPGAGIAFLITGAGTSIGAISGLLVIARGRVVALVIGTLVFTAIATGWLAGWWL
ncbi:MAG TPA: permease [Propionicimonas sp.]|nr:permease [Propionicimonas sp.]HQD96043.1 permease [Propionicimonas sp.]